MVLHACLSVCLLQCIMTYLNLRWLISNKAINQSKRQEKGLNALKGYASALKFILDNC